MLRQRGPVQRHELRHVGDRGFDRPVARAVSRTLPGASAQRVLLVRTTSNRAQAAGIEGVPLDDHDRAPVSGLRAGRIAEVGPPDVTPGDHHSEDSRVASAAVVVKPPLSG